MQFVCKQFKGEISVVTGDHFRDIFKGGATSPAMRVFDEIQRGSDDKIYCSNSQLTAVFEDMILTPTFDSAKNPLFNPQGPSDLLNRYFAAKYATHDAAKQLNQRATLTRPASTAADSLAPGGRHDPVPARSRRRIGGQSFFLSGPSGSAKRQLAHLAHTIREFHV